MNKICTSLEQSKKLIELGICIDTADMIYSTFYGEVSKSLPMPKEVYEYFKYPIDGDKCVPAWSLGALMGLIPDIVEDFVLRLDKVDGEYFIWYDEIGKGWSDAMAHPSSENFIDAAFEMICWLKENGKI